MKAPLATQVIEERNAYIAAMFILIQIKRQTVDTVPAAIEMLNSLVHVVQHDFNSARYKI